MRYFYDTEFLEDGKTIDLISIGIVAEDGRQYYAESRDADWPRILNEPWLRTKVVPQLGHPDFWKPRWKIAREVRDFLLFDGEPELWAWYAAYDHVVLCQLFGRMVDLPKGMPMFTNDLKQVVGVKGIPGLPEQTVDEHDALADALHLQKMFEFVSQNKITI